MNAAQGLADRGRRAKELYDRYLGDFEIWFAEEYYHTLQREEVRRSASSACHGRSVWLMEVAWRGARLASIRGLGKDKNCDLWGPGCSRASYLGPCEAVFYKFVVMIVWTRWSVFSMRG